MTSADDRPIILIAPRLEQPKPCLQMPERLAPEETGATVFLEAILAAGGLPLIMTLTEDEDVIARYIEMADGVASRADTTSTRRCGASRSRMTSACSAMSATPSS